jgi:hypothetical protein
MWESQPTCNILPCNIEEEEREEKEEGKGHGRGREEAAAYRAQQR